MSQEPSISPGSSAAPGNGTLTLREYVRPHWGVTPAELRVEAGAYF